jgi:hypothetical protein
MEVEMGDANVVMGKFNKLIKDKEIIVQSTFF